MQSKFEVILSTLNNPTKIMWMVIKYQNYHKYCLQIYHYEHPSNFMSIVMFTDSVNK